MEIDCNYVSHNWFQLGTLYICKITSASILEKNQEIKAIVGEHDAGKTDLDVEVLWFHCTEVHYMPKGISKIFPNLKGIFLYLCGLEEITREDLVGLENIEALYFRCTKLKSLPDNLFEGFKNLKWIDFYDNKLEFVSSQLLQPVLGNQLKLVDFRMNPTIDAAFDASEVNPSCEFASEFLTLPDLIKLIDEKCKKPTRVENQMKPSTSGEPLGTFKDNFLRSFKNFWASGKFSDFTIIVDDKKFKVHKTVLAMQSKYFAETFEKSDDAIVELKTEDFSVEAVEAVLNWMYTGEIGDVENAAEVFSIAMKLEILGLKAIAEVLALKSIDEDNAMEIYKLGIQYNSKILKESAFNELKKFLADPSLEDKIIDEPEKLEKLVEVKQIYEEIKKSF